MKKSNIEKVRHYGKNFGENIEDLCPNWENYKRDYDIVRQAFDREKDSQESDIDFMLKKIQIMCRCYGLEHLCRIPTPLRNFKKFLEDFKRKLSSKNGGRRRGHRSENCGAYG